MMYINIAILYIYFVNRYSVDPGDYDPGVGVIIRSIKGSLNREDVEVIRLDQDTGVLELTETEELVSNIMEIKPTDNEKKLSVSLLSSSMSYKSRLPTSKRFV